MSQSKHLEAFLLFLITKNWEKPCSKTTFELLCGWAPVFYSTFKLCSTSLLLENKLWLQTWTFSLCMKPLTQACLTVVLVDYLFSVLLWNFYDRSRSYLIIKTTEPQFSEVLMFPTVGQDAGHLKFDEAITKTMKTWKNNWRRWICGKWCISRQQLCSSASLSRLYHVGGDDTKEPWG